MKKQNIIMMIIAVIVFLSFAAFATYAYFTTGNLNITNVVNANTVTEQNNMVFDVIGGNMSLNMSLAKMADGAAFNYVAAISNNTTLTVNFTPNTDYSMVCTYDIVYEWTSSDRYTTHSPGVTGNEFTIQAFQTYAENTINGAGIVTEETDLSTLTYNNNSVTIVSGAQISGAGNTTSTAVWNLISRVYNVKASQTALDGKNFAGKFKIANVACVAGEVETTVIASGNVNEDITWTLDDNGTLKIMGTGAMPNYPTMIDQPWDAKRSSIESVVIENGITSIGDRSFYNLSYLKSVNIPSSVTSIGVSAFNSTRLTSITIPSSVTTIGNNAFSDSYLVSITIPDSVTSLGTNVFNNCKNLTSATLPSNITTIPNSLFYGCRSLTSITIPSSVTSIGSYAFYSNTSLTSITVPDTVTSLGTGVFQGCKNLTSATLPSNITTIPNIAFQDCSSLTSITIPSSVTSVGSNAFRGTGLTSITIPSSVTSIDNYAFRYCTYLSSVIYNGNTYTTQSGFTSAYGGTLGSDVFTGTSLGA